MGCPPASSYNRARTMRAGPTLVGLGRRHGRRLTLPADRRLCPDRRLPDGGPHFQGRLARLALHPPPRQPGGVLRPPGPAGRRPLLRPPARELLRLPPL